MAVLDSTQRGAVRQEFMARISLTRTGLALTKPQLAAAIAAIDDWVEANFSSFNSALPVAARTNLSLMQKLLLLIYVATKRMEE